MAHESSSPDEPIDWQRYIDRLFAYARKVLHQPHGNVEPSDIATSVIRTFLRRRSAGKIPEINDESQLWPLLGKLAYAKSMEANRKQVTDSKHQQKLHQQSSQVGEPSQDEFVEFQDFVDTLINQLPESEQKVARLKLLDYDHEQIAEQCEIVPRTVSRRLAEIRLKWSKLLENPDDGPL